MKNATTEDWQVTMAAIVPLAICVIGAVIHFIISSIKAHFDEEERKRQVIREFMRDTKAYRDDLAKYNPASADLFFKEMSQFAKDNSPR